MSNKTHSVLYTGVTSDLIKRVYEHKSKLVEGFTRQYNISKLVYYEIHESVEQAILREKRIKGWVRARKNELVGSMNPVWCDLYSEILGDPSAASRPQDDVEPTRPQDDVEPTRPQDDVEPTRPQDDGKLAWARGDGRGGLWSRGDFRRLGVISE